MNVSHFFLVVEESICACRHIERILVMVSHWGPKLEIHFDFKLATEVGEQTIHSSR
jgi:hypothetical protein